MLAGEILGVVVVAGLLVGALSRRRSHDDVHSVEGYHRQLTTLEHIAHPTDGEHPGGPHAESALRTAGTRTVRLTGPGAAPAPPEPPAPATAPPAVAPPAIAPSAGTPAAGGTPPADRVTFDDAKALPVTPSGSLKRQDRAMNAMNRRPRRLAAPALAVASVTVLIVVLLVSGLHKTPPPSTHHQSHAATPPVQTRPTQHTQKGHRARTTATTTTTLPVVSLPTATSTHAATYKVANNSFTLVLGATTGPCWVDLVSAGSNTTLFTGVLSAGEQHSVAATGPVTLEVGAPSAFSGSVDGTAVVLPFGYQTPFTLTFQPAAPSST